MDEVEDERRGRYHCVQLCLAASLGREAYFALGSWLGDAPNAMLQIT